MNEKWDISYINYLTILMKMSFNGKKQKNT